MDKNKAIIEAKKYSLEKEVEKLINSGMSPDNALWELRILVEDVEFVNLTPHTITLNSGVSYPSQGVARVSNSFTDFDANNICTVVYGDVTGLPDPKPNTVYIVSALVLSALKGKREDVVAPATGHPDCVRKDGFIVSVPGFVK